MKVEDEGTGSIENQPGALEALAKRMVVQHIKLTVDMDGHIAFDGTCRVDAVRAYRKLAGCSARDARIAIETAIARYFGVGLVEFVARLAYASGVLAAKAQQAEDAQAKEAPPTKPVPVPKQAKAPTLNTYDKCFRGLNHEPHGWRNADATEAVCDGEGTVTVDRMKTGYTSAGHATETNTWAPYTTDDACGMKHRHVVHTWPHSDGMTELECDGQQNITRSGIARAAVMPGANTTISKLRRLDLRKLQSIAMQCGVSKAALVGMTADELVDEIYQYSVQNPTVPLIP